MNLKQTGDIQTTLKILPSDPDHFSMWLKWSIAQSIGVTDNKLIGPHMHLQLFIFCRILRLGLWNPEHKAWFGGIYNTGPTLNIRILVIMRYKKGYKNSHMLKQGLYPKLLKIVNSGCQGCLAKELGLLPVLNKIISETRAPVDVDRIFTQLCQSMSVLWD